MKTIKVGILGFGNIGTGTYELLEMNRQEDAVVIPMGAKWEIENVGPQVVRFAVSLSPCR